MNERLVNLVEYYEDMLVYPMETSTSMSRRRYPRETVTQNSMLRNAYNVEDIDEYDHHEISRNNLRSLFVIHVTRFSRIFLVL